VDVNGKYNIYKILEGNRVAPWGTSPLQSHKQGEKTSGSPYVYTYPVFIKLTEEENNLPDVLLEAVKEKEGYSLPEKLNIKYAYIDQYTLFKEWLIEFLEREFHSPPVKIGFSSQEALARFDDSTSTVWFSWAMLRLLSELTHQIIKPSDLKLFIRSIFYHEFISRLKENYAERGAQIHTIKNYIIKNDKLLKVTLRILNNPEKYKIYPEKNWLKALKEIKRRRIIGGYSLYLISTLVITFGLIFNIGYLISPGVGAILGILANSIIKKYIQRYPILVIPFFIIIFAQEESASIKEFINHKIQTGQEYKEPTVELWHKLITASILAGVFIPLSKYLGYPSLFPAIFTFFLIIMWSENNDDCTSTPSEDDPSSGFHSSRSPVIPRITFLGAAYEFLAEIGVKKGSKVLDIGLEADAALPLAAAHMGAYFIGFNFDSSYLESAQMLLELYSEEIEDMARLISGEFSSGTRSKSKGIIADHSQDFVLILTGALSDPWPRPPVDYGALVDEKEVFSETLRVIKNGGKILVGTYFGAWRLPIFWRSYDQYPKTEEMVAEKNMQQVLNSPQWKGKVQLKKIGEAKYSHSSEGNIYEVTFTDAESSDRSSSPVERPHLPSLPINIINAQSLLSKGYLFGKRGSLAKFFEATRMLWGTEQRDYLLQKGKIAKGLAECMSMLLEKSLKDKFQHISNLINHVEANVPQIKTKEEHKDMELEMMLEVRLTKEFTIAKVSEIQSKTNLQEVIESIRKILTCPFPVFPI